MLPHIRVATHSIFPGLRFPRRLLLFFCTWVFSRLLNPIPKIALTASLSQVLLKRPELVEVERGHVTGKPVASFGRPFLRRAPNLMPHKPGIGGTLLPRLKMATVPTSPSASQWARQPARDGAGGSPWPEAPPAHLRPPAVGGVPASSRRGQSARGAVSAGAAGVRGV